MIRKALILAAGLGTRLRPFTCVTPKPLLPVWGEPMIDRIAAMLRERGVDDICVNAHYLNEQVERWAEEFRAKMAAEGAKVEIRVSYEPEILGSGGAMDPLREWIGDDPFYLVNSDVVMENVPDIAAEFERRGADAIGCALVSEQGPRTIEVEPESGYVTNWKSDDAGMDGTFTYCGFAALSPEILGYVRKGASSSVVEAFEKAMMDGKFVKTVKDDELLWEDAGTISSYVNLNQSGDENAFGDFPQLAALGVTDARFIGARGSERVFFGSGEGIAILYDDAKRTENGLYAEQARWLAEKGAPVPKVIRDLPEKKALLMEDVGSERKMKLEEYVKVVEALERFNRLGESADLPKMMAPFDASLWEWERKLFEEHCLEDLFHRELPPAARKELEAVSEALEREPKALVHRDFQSTNVLWKGDRLSFIDFQGMRLGPAVYDLASLVYDSYVEFSEGERRALVALYAKRAGREEVVKVLPFAAVQRLVQCLGAFGRLASVGQPQFLKFVMPALVNLLDAADRAGLEAVGALAEDLIGAYNHAHHHEGKCNHDHGGGECTCGHHHH